MSFSFARSVRLVVLALATTALALLAACGGSSTIEQPFQPQRVVAMGDGLADVGQVAGVRYTVNDGTVNTWVQQVAASYGLGLTAQSAGGQDWARGNARVAAKPDAVGNTATLTIAEQIDAFLASGGVQANDLILLDSGISDMVFQAQELSAGRITEAQLIDNLNTAAIAMADQARRLVNAGAKNVMVAGVYDLGSSPFAKKLGLSTVLSNATVKYNEALLVKLYNYNLGGKVLYAEVARRYANIVSTPATYGLSNVVDAACAGSAATCTPTTLAAGADYAKYLFADDRYPTPAVQRTVGDYAASLLKSTW
jgi:outer membrane lipase/esterase